MPSQLNPDLWLTSTIDSLTDYIHAGVNGFIRDDTNTDVGLQVYEISFDFPEADGLPSSPELNKTIIHLIVDNIDNKRIGFGPSYTDYVESPGPGGSVVTTPAEAREHEINFDVGIWASDKSGGTTSRLRAYEMLDKLFGSDIARRKCRDFTGGVEIISYQSGRFITDTIGDIRVFRVAGAELIVRVYSRDADIPVILADQEPQVVPDVIIYDDLHING